MHRENPEQSSSDPSIRPLLRSLLLELVIYTPLVVIYFLLGYLRQLLPRRRAVDPAPKILASYTQRHPRGSARRAPGRRDAPGRLMPPLAGRSMRP